MEKIVWKKIGEARAGFTADALKASRGCPVCGALEKTNILTINDFQFYTDSRLAPKRFDVHQNVCSSCFALYLDPCYSDYGFEVLFSEAGQSYGSTSEHTKEQIDWLADKNLIREGSRLLDVGCYEGGFLSQLPETIEKFGVDIDQPAINRGALKYSSADITFYCGNFETFDFSGAPPDTITMYHVLEHLPRPVRVLNKLKEISDDATKLVIEVPVLENGNTNDICGGFFSIQHTTHFSKRSLINCLQQAGWEVTDSFEVPDYNGFRVVASRSSSSEYAPVTGDPGDWIEMRSSIAALQQSIAEVERQLQLIPSSDKLIIWGGGAHVEFLYQFTTLFRTTKWSDFIIVDSDPLKQGKTWRGINIYDPMILENTELQSLPLLVSTYGGQSEVASAAVGLGFDQKTVHTLYESITRY